MRACWLKWVGRDWSISADYIWLNYSGANRVGVRGRIHAEKIAATATCCAHVESRWLSKYWIVPFDGEGDTAACGAIAVLISTYCGLCGLFRIRQHVGS
mgnify:CR=1 FL=1